MCKKYDTVALNLLVGFFKGASPHRKVHSMLGFSNVGMLALLTDTAANQTWRCRKKRNGVEEKARTDSTNGVLRIKAFTYPNLVFF